MQQKKQSVNYLFLFSIYNKKIFIKFFLGHGLLEFALLSKSNY